MSENYPSMYHNSSSVKIVGTLEKEIMRLVWQKEEITVKEVCNDLCRRRKVAYTSVQTVMNRLVDKGILIKSLVGRQNIYKPTLTKKEFIKQAISDIIDSFNGDL